MDESRPCFGLSFHWAASGSEQLLLDPLTAKLALLMESPVLLGVPDGPITDAADLKNPRMSRLGGEPVRDDLTPLDAVCGLLTPHRTIGQNYRRLAGVAHWRGGAAGLDLLRCLRRPAAPARPK